MNQDRIHHKVLITIALLLLLAYCTIYFLQSIIQNLLLCLEAVQLYWFNGGEENEEEEDDELSARRKKPWGHTSYFCPVALKKNGVLWPGNQELAARYRDKLYCFNSEEAKESFLADPLQYVADSSCPIQVHNNIALHTNDYT